MHLRLIACLTREYDDVLSICSFTLTGHAELIRLLIYSGFNVKQKDDYGQTVLHLACINGNLNAIKQMCEQVGTLWTCCG